ncbi:DNA-binding PadR family transcriptional regulator [Sphingomonas jejuensis]|uniref:DNA-binding PadR family transcriptional regulator n=1 Tax=Sphingomonas jejuensis TaxID=904715 RepID=A0ABX0XJ82_9SPHN|nr:PadR family transcriptional regulator [Sphingomonas jejuensis]NJC33386.1 DNA-binding PadR family transcriptional regulator [Sphingomonas jejuensis]
MFGFHHGSHGRGCGPRGGRFQGGPFQFEWSVDGAGRGMRGGRRRMFDGSELRLVLIALIGQQPRYGYDLIREIEALTGGGYAPSPGVIYPTLTLLSDMYLIAEAESEGSKKLFALTPDGEAYLAKRREEADALLARLRDMGAERTRGDRAPVRRAVGNLKAVLQHRLADEDDAEVSHRIAAMIDELAQKIERL